MADKQEIPIAAEIWLIKFDDADVPDEVFVGEDAEKCAREVFELRNYSWNCHLFGPAERISTLAHQLSREKAELAMVDEALARRPAVADAPNRYTAISAAFNMASRTDHAEKMEKHWKGHYERLESENARLTEALRVKEEECDRLRDRERDVCAAVTRQCDVKKINEIMQDTLKARAARALLAARRTQEREEA